MNIVRIKVDNVHGYIIDPIPDIVFKDLRFNCSYVAKQVSYTARQYGYRPHPTHRFNTNKSFRIGLLGRVQGILRQHNIVGHVEPVDDTIFPSAPELSIMNSWDLRDYQVKSVEDILSRKKTAHEIATGGGKTIIMGDVVAKVAVKTTILTNSTVLLHQTASVLRQMLKTDIGIVGDSIFDPKDITVAMVQSLEGVHDKGNISPNRDDKRALIQDTRFLIIDECHRIAAKTIFELSSWFKNAYHAAYFTATMRRLDGRDLDLEAAAGPINYSVDMHKLIEEGWLVRPEVYYIDAPVRYVSPKNAYIENCKVYNTLREFYIDTHMERTELIARVTQRLADAGHSTLVAVRHIAQGNSIKDMLPSAIEIYADTYNRVQLFNDFKDGKIPIVISTLCKEGIDIPRCSAVVIAHDTQDAQQLVGRIVRKFKGKDKAIVLHLVDSHPVFKKHVKHNEKIFYRPQKIKTNNITEQELDDIF